MSPATWVLKASFFNYSTQSQAAWNTTSLYQEEGFTALMAECEGLRNELTAAHAAANQAETARKAAELDAKQAVVRRLMVP